MNVNSKSRLSTIGFASLVAISAIVLSSCGDDGGSDSEDSYLPADLSDLVGEWTYESGTMSFDTETGVDSYEMSLIQKPMAINITEKRYFWTSPHFVAIELVEEEFGADAKVPQQVALYDTGTSEDPVYADVESGSIRMLESGNIETKFRLTGTTTTDEGESLDFIILIEGVASRSPKDFPETNLRDGFHSKQENHKYGN